MNLRRSSTTLMLVPLLVLAGLLAGCGGGQPEGGSQQGGGDGQQADAARESAPDAKIAIGTVARINPDNNRRIVVRSRQGEGQESQVFKIRENAQITLDGKQAGVEDLSEDQQVRVDYVVKDGTNRALSLQLFTAEEQPSGEEGGSN